MLNARGDKVKESAKYWWQDRAWRIVQTNMREIDMLDISAQQYVKDLQEFNANTVIINTGGIVASYDTKFPFHFNNEYLKGDSLKDVIKACQDAGIKVFSRVDFSKVRTPVYEKHPDWAYMSPKGNIIDYHGNIHVCFNSEYQQKHALSIMREIIEELNPDGIFMNMGGYFVAYDYTHGWQGICQCENCQKRFYDRFGESLPKIEDENDPVFQKYLIFQRETTKEYYKNIHDLFAEIKPDLCFSPHADMQRWEAGTFIEHESQNFHFKASEIIKSQKYTYPDSVASVTTVDFIDMMYRFSAVSPYQQEMRVVQSLANGGTADYYMCGRLDTHRDKSGFKPLQKIYKYHKEHEDDYVNITSNAKMLLVKPFADFHNRLNNDILAEYYGWYYILSENHYLFDCVSSSAFANMPIDKYETIILPDINKLSISEAEKLDNFAENGGTIISTGYTGIYNEESKRHREPVIKSLGIKRIGKLAEGLLSAYFQFDSKEGFPRFESTDLVYLYDTYIYADYEKSAETYLRLIPPHFFAPPEAAYHTNITDYPAFTVNSYGKGRGVSIPWHPAKAFKNLGFPNTYDFIADILENVLNIKPLETTAPPMVEISFTKKNDDSSQYVHLINGTGYFIKSYYEPIELRDLKVSVPLDKKPSAVTSMVANAPVNFEYKEGMLSIDIDKLNLFEAIKIN